MFAMSGGGTGPNPDCPPTNKGDNFRGIGFFTLPDDGIDMSKLVEIVELPTYDALIANEPNLRDLDSSNELGRWQRRLIPFNQGAPSAHWRRGRRSNYGQH